MGEAELIPIGEFLERLLAATRRTKSGPGAGKHYLRKHPEMAGARRVEVRPFKLPKQGPRPASSYRGARRNEALASRFNGRGAV